MKKLKFNAAGMFIGCILLLFACNPAKQAARKDDKAIDRVTGSRKLIDRMLPIVLDLYPCANDTTTVWIAGGVDSIPYPVPKLDTAQKKKVIDSLNAAFASDCDVAMNESYESGYKNAVLDMQRKKAPVPLPDTIIKTIVDKQRAKADAQTIQQLQTQVNTLQSLIDEKGKWLWWFIGALVLLVLTNAFWIFSKIK